MLSRMKTRPADSMTLQLMIACQEDSIVKARREDRGSALWFIPFSLKSRSCYKVFWGVYGGEAEARKALDTLPAELKSGRPQMVTLGAALSNASH
jgi:septal ring-binding cell division protein DamX